MNNIRLNESGQLRKVVVKVTGACGLLNAYPGTQSGKLLGGKLANTESQYFYNSPSNNLKTG